MLVSESEYLRNPEYERSEWVDGYIVERFLGSRKHSRIAVKCSRFPDQYFDTHPGGTVYSEPHCRLTISGRLRYRLPDVAVALNESDQDALYLTGAPDLAIEIKSPEDVIASQLCKLDEYFANGTRLAWLIVPEEKKVLIVTPGWPIRTAMAGETLDGGDLLPGWSIPVDSLFGLTS